MAYFAQLQGAAQWLLQRRNADQGWGMVPGQPSSMVNTAEALYVLAKANSTSTEMAPSLDFIKSSIRCHLEKRGPRTRYVSLPLLTLAECFPTQERQTQKFMLDWLLRARNSDHGWGDEANNDSSDIFSTYLAASALFAARGFTDEPIVAAGNWMLQQHREEGWAMHEAQPYSPTATAYAVATLRIAELQETAAYHQGREMLLSNDGWDNEEVVISGTKWLHSKSTAIIRALVQSETDTMHPTVAEGVRSFQRRITDDGWTERPIENKPTIRSQYWAVYGLDALIQHFDPSILIPRLDAMRQQGVLREPQYLPFAVNTPFHTIIPASIFRIVVWTGLVLGLLAAPGFLSLLPLPSSSALPPVGLAVLMGAIWLISKRPTQFPRMGRWMRRLILFLGLVGTVYGTSPADVADWLKAHLQTFFGNIANSL